METDTHSDKLTDLEDEEGETKEDEEEVEQDEPETSKAVRSGSPGKRSLVEEEDVEMEDIEPVPSPAPEQTQGSAVEEVVIRRKRLRA